MHLNTKRNIGVAWTRGGGGLRLIHIHPPLTPWTAPEGRVTVPFPLGICKNLPFPLHPHIHCRKTISLLPSPSMCRKQSSLAPAKKNGKSISAGLEVQMEEAEEESEPLPILESLNNPK